MSLPTKPYWTHYDNVEYIRIDFSNSPNDECSIQIVTDAVALGIERQKNSIRALLIAKGSKVRPETMRTMKKIAKEVQPNMKKSAIVGVVGILSLLMRIYIAYTKSTIRFFTNEKAALDYITKD